MVNTACAKVSGRFENIYYSRKRNKDFDELTSNLQNCIRENGILKPSEIEKILANLPDSIRKALRRIGEAVPNCL